MSTREPLELRPGSRELRAILGATRGIAGTPYEGALPTLADTANPARERMAADALREVIEQLEKEAGLEDDDGLGRRNRVITLRESWQAAPRTADGSLQVPLAIAETIDLFVEDYDADYPSRRARAHMTIVGLDPAAREGPPACETRASLRSWSSAAGSTSPCKLATATGRCCFAREARVDLGVVPPAKGQISPGGRDLRARATG